MVGEMKIKLESSELCKDLPLEFCRYFDFVKKMHFKSQPDYKYLSQLFKRIAVQNGIQYDWVFDWTEEFNSKKSKNDASPMA